MDANGYSDFLLRGNAQNMLDLYSDIDTADLTISCEAHEWRIHSFLFTPRSFMFKKAVNGIVEIPGQKPGIVKKMIDYFYFLNYDDTKFDEELETNNAYESTLCTNAQVYALAGKYGLNGLKQLAETKFDARVAALPAFGMGYTVLLEALDYVFNSTPDEDRRLKDKTLIFAQRHWRNIVACPTFFETICTNLRFLLEVVERRYSSMELSG